MADEFSRFHPLVQIVFFCFVMGITIFQMQIILALISFLSAAVYQIYLKRWRGLAYLGIIFCAMIPAALINPLFSHRGTTRLFYLFTGNAVTWEAIVYGFVAAIIIGAVMLWFVAIHEIVTADKLIAVLGNMFPHITVLLLMIFRFIPKIAAFQKKVKEADKALQADPKRFSEKIKRQSRIISITTTWALENSIDTADSMRARGFGCGKRSFYHNNFFSPRDVVVFVWIMVLSLLVIWQIAVGNTISYYYPVIRIKGHIFIYIIYVFLCMTPLIVDLWEEIRWHRLKSKI